MDENIKKIFGDNEISIKTTSLKYFGKNFRIGLPLFPLFLKQLKIKEKKVKSIILNHVTNYMNNSWVQYTIKAFYKYLGIWNIDHLCKIMYEFFKLLSEDTIDENYYLMVQSIDLFSWGIMLLQYANKIKDLCDRGVIDISLYSDVHKNIYKFLKFSLFLSQ